MPYNIMVASKPLGKINHLNSTTRVTKPLQRIKPHSSKLIIQSSRPQKQLHLPFIDKNLQQDRYLVDKKQVYLSGNAARQLQDDNQQEHRKINDFKFKKQAAVEKPIFLSHQNLNIPGL